MKLIIDIPEKIEEYIKDYIPIGAGNNVFCYPDEIVRMIQNGTPIPDNVPTVDVLDKIRDEMEQVKSIMNEEIINHDRKDLINFVNGLNQSLVIINKAESEVE